MEELKIMEEKRESLFVDFLKWEITKSVQTIHKSETIVNLDLVSYKDFQAGMETLPPGYALLIANTELDHEIALYASEKDSGFLTKKNLNRETIYTSLLQLEGGLTSKLFLRPKPKVDSEYYAYPSFKLIRKLPEEFSEEFFWLSDKGKIFKIQLTSFLFYLVIKEDSFFKIPIVALDRTKTLTISEVQSQKISISNPYEFVLGRYLLPFTGNTKQYEIGIKIQEVIHFNSLSINQKFGISFKSSIKYKNKSYDNYFFIPLQSQAEIKSYNAALLDILTNLTERNLLFLKEHLGDEKYEQDVLLEVEPTSLVGKKLTLFKADFRISKNHLSLFLLVDPAYLLALSEKFSDDLFSKAFKKNPLIPHLVYELNTTLLHKEKDIYPEFSYSTVDLSSESVGIKKFLLIARFINLIDSRDLMVFVQNYLIQNYKTAELVGLFYYSLLNTSTNTKKNMVVPEFDEKRFTKFLVGVHVEEFEFQKTKEAKPITQLYDENLRFFLELNQALKLDKLVLSTKGRHVFYDVFMKHYMETKRVELDALGSLTEYIKDVKAFHKKFASDMIAELSKEVICISYIDNREAVDFLTTFMSKNRKEQIFEDYQYFKKQFKDNKIDILDVFDARKVLFQKYKDLKQALIDEGMV